MTANAYSRVTEFIHGLYHTEGLVPLHPPYFGGNEKKYLCECIDTGFVSSVGEFVNRFERDIAAYTGARSAVVCVNGTNAIHLALLLVGVEPGDEVLTQPLTFIATCNAIGYLGAQAVFLDVDRRTLGLSPEAMRIWLREHAELRDGACFNKGTGRRIKACLPMHTFGHPADLDGLLGVCRDYHLELVEDAAEGMGSYYHDRHVGTFGRVGVLSFNGNKTITTGGGGMLAGFDKALIDRARKLSQQSREPAPHYEHVEIGYNYRMTDVQAAIGRVQLERLPGIVARRREIARDYACRLAGIEGVAAPREPDWARSNWQSYCVRLAGADQRWTMQALLNRGISTRRGIMNAHLEGAYLDRGCSVLGSDLARSEAAQNSSIILPLSFQMSEAELAYVAETLGEILSRRGRAAA